MTAVVILGVTTGLIGFLAGYALRPAKPEPAPFVGEIDWRDAE